MKQLLHIIHYKLISFFVISFDGSAKTAFKNTAAGLVYAGFAYGMYSITLAILNNLINIIHLNIFLFHRFAAIVLFIFFLAVNAGNIMVSISGLFKSKEINFLLTKPIKYENIFLIKFFDNFFYSSTTLFLILFAVLIAYGNFFHLGFRFYLFSVIGLFLPFTLIAALSGVLLLFFLLFLVKKAGLKPTAALLIFLYLAGIILFFMSNNPSENIQKVMGSEIYAMQYFQHLDSIYLKMLPNFWVSNALFWFIRGNIILVAEYVFLLYSAAAALLIINYVIASKYFFEGYLTASELRLFPDNERRKNLPVVSFESLGGKHPVFRAMLKKELAMFLRDPAQVLQLGFMIILIVLFAASISGKPHSIFTSLNPAIQTTSYLVFIVFNSFLICSLALRYVFPHQSLEGETYWKLLSAPVNSRKIIFTKFVFYFCLILVLAEGLNFFSHQKFSNVLLIFSSILTFLVTLTAVSVNFSFGLLFVNYKERNPIRIASSQGASTAFLICLVYLGIVIGVLFPPLFNFFLVTHNMKAEVDAVFFLKPLGVIGIISALIIFACFLISKKQMMKDFIT